MRKLSFILLFIMGGFIFQTCSHDNVDVSGFEPVCYDDVMSVYASCTKCHQGGEQDFSSMSAIRKHGIVPYQPLKSEYYKVLVDKWQIMPPNAPVGSVLRTKIRIWIEQGADSIPCNK
jgi:hypothetical protein